MADGTLIASGLKLARPVLEDFAYIMKRMRPDEIEQFLALSGLREYDPDVAARAFAMTAGPTFVLVEADNKPVILGGFEPKRRGVYEAWLAGTMEGWDKHWRRITRECMRQMDTLLTVGAHRIEVCALASRTRTHAWYERIGFVREARLTGYCADGSDAIMFARTR
jgi:hypothetical protein